MTPFPEAEIMTIKRLEVALRKMDYKLLKDGAYKLHEKFHGGHKFEYLDLLEEILLEVSENTQVPSDIKDILCPTIEDILLQAKAEESLVQTQSTTPKLQENAPKISAFDAFGSQKDTPVKYFSQQSPFSAQPFKDFNNASGVRNNSTPLFFTDQVPYNSKQEKAQEIEQNNEYIEKNNNENNKISNNETIQNEVSYEENNKVIEEIEAPKENIEENIQSEIQEYQEKYQDVVQQEPVYEEAQEEYQADYQNKENIEEYIEPKSEEIFEENVEQDTQEYNNNYQEEHQEEIIEEQKEEEKTIAIFYGQDISSEKIKNIINYRKLLQQAKEGNNIGEIFKLISEITTQANTGVVELKGILEKLKSNNYRTNLITNSQSAKFFELFDLCGIEYDLYDVDFKTDVNLSALYGLSNLFSCLDCEEKYLDINNDIKPLILECPKCKCPMYPDFYTPSAEYGLNMEYYNSSFVSLANSKTWLLIHPSFNDKISSDMIEYAYRTNKNIENIYILEKDINVRETYKYVFSKINPNVRIYADNNTLEDFLNSI